MMSKILKSLKTKAMNIGLKFLSIDEKFAYIAFKTKSSNVKPIVILPTSQTTLKKLKNRMRELKQIGNLHNGLLNGVPISIVQAGMGSPHAAIVMEALKRSPCKVVIRLDYCGGIKTVDEDLDIADVIIPNEVFLTDGTSHSYMQTYSDKIKDLSMNSYSVEKDVENTLLYPSYKDNYWSAQSNALLEGVLWDSIHSHAYDFTIKSGKLWSVDALFCETEPAVKTWASYGANSVDMESSAVYLLGQLFGIKTLSILGISDLPDSNEWNFQKTNKIHPKYEFILDNAIDVLFHALPKIKEKVISK